MGLFAMSFIHVPFLSFCFFCFSSSPGVVAYYPINISSPPHTRLYLPTCVLLSSIFASLSLCTPVVSFQFPPCSLLVLVLGFHLVRVIYCSVFIRFYSLLSPLSSYLCDRLVSPSLVYCLLNPVSPRLVPSRPALPRPTCLSCPVLSCPSYPLLFVPLLPFLPPTSPLQATHPRFTSPSARLLIWLGIGTLLTYLPFPTFSYIFMRFIFLSFLESASTYALQLQLQLQLQFSYLLFTL